MFIINCDDFSISVLRINLFTMIRYLLLVTLLILLPCVSRSQNRTRVQELSHLTLMAYNVENLFDTIASNSYQDSDFTPTGAYTWTAKRYRSKLRKIAQVILAVDTIHPADIIALEEVESDTVLYDLLHNTPLRTIGYHYLITKSLDSRGVNTALVYNPLQFRLLKNNAIRIDNHKYRTRDVMHAIGVIPNGDTLHIFVVHLPSQLGGKKALRMRKILLSKISQTINTIFSSHLHPKVIVLGDFNASPHDSEIRKFVLSIPSFVNLSENRNGGSYKFRGRWEWIDQMIISSTLLNESASIFIPVPKLQVYSHPTMLESDFTYGQLKPRRTFLGNYYHGGFSDHLPIFIKMLYRFK